MSDDTKPRLPVTRTSLFSGVTRTRELPVTQEQLDRYAAGDTLSGLRTYVPGDMSLT